jgi:hypothetical protein
VRWHGTTDAKSSKELGDCGWRTRRLAGLLPYVSARVVPGSSESWLSAWIEGGGRGRHKSGSKPSHRDAAEK